MVKVLTQDPDSSIRERALELVCLLVNESNVKPLTKELVDYLEVSEPEFKGDLTAKICSIMEKFSPEKIWCIDQMVKVLTQGPDSSIRKRALELVCLLVNESNVKPLTKELVDYLEVSEPEFKGDLTAKICSIMEKFSPEKIWCIDQMVKVLTQAGNYVKDEVWHALIIVITNAPNLHGYTVKALNKAVQTAGGQETLVRVAVWCIGEYREMLVGNSGMLDVEERINVILSIRHQELITF
ncbi:AP-1 complex subunit gamma-2-like isoform X2 [Sesamum indicum]|uniref:AP-1 complex subunit gamma-2-like isoform X2 n=1 Tax=Sesamum indicum TaxID=4182 RepID=A0A6I9UGC5_SESIN|nr:AP-1 complex subunit gamma-2-like isoform X2 [Sesamum indicum]